MDFLEILKKTYTGYIVKDCSQLNWGQIEILVAICHVSPKIIAFVKRNNKNCMFFDHMALRSGNVTKTDYIIYNCDNYVIFKGDLFSIEDRFILYINKTLISDKTACVICCKDTRLDKDTCSICLDCYSQACSMCFKQMLDIRCYECPECGGDLLYYM